MGHPVKTTPSDIPTARRDEAVYLAKMGSAALGSHAVEPAAEVEQLAERLSSATNLVLEKYRIVRKLGRGSYATVYEAENVYLKRRVALKVFDRCKDETERQMAFVEARAAAQIQHPACIDVIDFGHTNTGEPVIVMELIDGETLHALIHQVGTLTVEFVCDVMIQVLGALSAVHGAGLVHRDVKPANVVVSFSPASGASAKLLDFGVVLDPSVRDLVGAHAGTFIFMAPEQLNSGLADVRTDVFSVGATLFEALTRTLAFRTASVRRYLQTGVHQLPENHRERGPHVPDELWDAVERALSTDPDKRFQTAAEFIDALLPFVGAGRADVLKHSATNIKAEAEFRERMVSSEIRLRTEAVARESQRPDTLLPPPYELAAPDRPKRYTEMARLVLIACVVAGLVVLLARMVQGAL